MTIQAPDIVVYDGERHSVWTFPLESCGDLPRFESEFFNTGMYRGYLATWLIEGDTLYLTEIKHARLNGAAAGVAELFPGRGPRVEASWFTGSLRIPGDFRSAHPRRKRDRFLEIRSGKVVRAGPQDDPAEGGDGPRPQSRAPK